MNDGTLTRDKTNKDGPSQGERRLPPAACTRPAFNVPVPKQKQQTHLIFNIRARVDGLLEEFSDICSAEFSKSPPQHGVKHKLITSGLPIKSKPRRLDPLKLEAARKEFQEM